MWQFFLGFGTGIYVGTYYDCKPFMNKIGDYIKDQCPPKKSD